MKSLSLSEPHIIAMVGAPGAGKTRFALQFAETFSAPFINDRPLRACATNPDEGSALGLEIIKQIMRTRETLVFEGELDMRVDRDVLIKLAKTHGYKVLFVWVQADQQAAKVRALKQIAIDEYERRIKHFSAPHESEPYIVISCFAICKLDTARVKCSATFFVDFPNDGCLLGFARVDYSPRQIG